VAGDLVEHVLEERQAGVEIGLAAAVEIHADADLRLQRVPADLCLRSAMYLSLSTVMRWTRGARR
jgi:hypothetical protein